MPHRQFGEILVVNTQQTSWVKGERPEDQEHEIIEIGFCYLNPFTLELSRKESILIKPYRSKVSAFCTRMTTLTQERLNAEGIAFPVACLLLKHRYETTAFAWASFGGDHRIMIERDCLARNAPNPLNTLHLDVRLLATLHLAQLQEPGMERMLALLKIPHVGTLHRADDGAWNTARILAHLLAQMRSVLGGGSDTSLPF